METTLTFDAPGGGVTVIFKGFMEKTFRLVRSLTETEKHLIMSGNEEGRVSVKISLDEIAGWYIIAGVNSARAIDTVDNPPVTTNGGDI